LQTQQIINWPPDYVVRYSKRAKRLSLNVISGKGLEVILPVRCSERHIVPFLEQQRQWVEKHLVKALYNPTKESAEALPHSLLLRSVDETWAVEYIDSVQRAKIITCPDEELVLLGNIEDKLTCRRLLIKWLKNKATFYLKDYLQQLSLETELSYNRFSLRGQKNRWGSCGADKSITLNYKLIFLPTDIVRYVIIHELCHTVYLDHSENFWQLVTSFVPNYRKLKQRLNNEAHLIPRWINLF